MRISKKKIFTVLAVLLFIGLIGASFAYTGTGFTTSKTAADYQSQTTDSILNKYNNTPCSAEASGVCSKVSDGDTIHVEGVGKVRLVGVNTPEKGVAGADAAKYFVEKLCLNKKVSLDIDNSKHSDKYGRTLAVVIVDGKNLNEMLLKEGLAEVMYIPPSEFNPNSWSYGTTANTGNNQATDTHTDNTASDSGSSSTYVGNSNSHKFHKPNCRTAQKISENNKVSFNTREEAISQGYEPCKVCGP